jgi:hypothetical protein
MMQILAAVRTLLLFVRLVQTDFYEEPQADHTQAAGRQLGRLLAFLSSNCLLFGRGSASGPQRCLRSEQGSADGQRRIKKVAV